MSIGASTIVSANTAELSAEGGQNEAASPSTSAALDIEKLREREQRRLEREQKRAALRNEIASASGLPQLHPNT